MEHQNTVASFLIIKVQCDFLIMLYPMVVVKEHT